MTRSQELVLSLLRTRLGTQDFSVICIDPDDWSGAIDFSNEHRITLVLYDFLKKAMIDLPPDISMTLKNTNIRTSVQSYRKISELRLINEKFDDADINMIVLKGLVLSKYLYDDITLRPSADIDIFVRHEEIDDAYKILVDLGYTWVEEWQPVREKAYRKTTHHWPLYHPGKRIFLELHSRFVPLDCSAHIKSDDVWSKAQIIEIEKEDYFILNDEDLVLYLCLNSAKDCWGSLLQLYDITTLIKRSVSLDWNSLIIRAKEWRCRRRLLIVCALLERLFNLGLPEIIIKAISKDSLLKTPLRIANQQLFTTDKTDQGFIPRHLWLNMLIADRWIDRLSIFSYKSHLQFIKMSTNGWHLRKPKTLDHSANS